MSTKYRFGESEVAHFITCTVVKWIDVFSRDEYKQIVVESLQFCTKEKGLVIHALVIMSNHLHLIISTKAENDLAGIVRDFKKFTAKQILKALENATQESRKDWMLWLFQREGSKNSNNEKYQFWIQDNHPIGLTTNDILKQRLNYIHENPVKAGLVWEPQQYKYSSAVDYYSEEKGLLPIEHL